MFRSIAPKKARLTLQQCELDEMHCRQQANKFDNFLFFNFTLSIILLVHKRCIYRRSSRDNSTGNLRRPIPDTNL